jgi:hypothetical protein
MDVAQKVSKSKSKLYYNWQSVGQSVLVSGTHLGPATNFSHSLWLFFYRQLRVCWYGAPSLTRSRVCRFQFLPDFASAAFLRSESHVTHELSLFLFLRLARPGGSGSCIYFPQEQGSSVIPPGIGLKSCFGLSWVYLTADGQSTSSSWHRAPLWGPWPDFILILSLVTIALLIFLLVRSLRTNNHTLPSHLRLCSLFVASYDSQGLRCRYSNPPPHRCSEGVDPSSNLKSLKINLFANINHTFKF